MSNRLADLLPLAERTYTRMEAQDLLDRCLREDDPSPLRDLVNRLLSESIPNLDLLRDLLSDVHAQMVRLRERRFDVRRQVVEAFKDGYGIDITLLAPPQDLDRYHHLTADSLEAYLRANHYRLGKDEESLLKEVFTESVCFAADLAADLKTVEALLDYLRDWITGYAGLAARFGLDDLNWDHMGLVL